MATRKQQLSYLKLKIHKNRGRIDTLLPAFPLLLLSFLSAIHGCTDGTSLQAHYAHRLI